MTRDGREEDKPQVLPLEFATNNDSIDFFQLDLNEKSRGNQEHDETLKNVVRPTRTRKNRKRLRAGPGR